MPVGFWCTENFDRITKQWGKTITIDDRTEESKSYTTARVLIDCFQWEKIHEWITVTVEDKSFHVFVKEFGSEIYSIQSHPDLVEDCSATMVDDRLETRVLENPVEVETSLASPNDSNLDLQRFVDPLIEEIIMSRWKNVHLINCEREICSVPLSELIHLEKDLVSCSIEVGGELLMGFDPALFEAQITSKKLDDEKRVFKAAVGPYYENKMESGRSDSLSFPPRFGLDRGFTNGLDALARSSNIPNPESENSESGWIKAVKTVPKCPSSSIVRETRERGTSDFLTNNSNLSPCGNDEVIEGKAKSKKDDVNGESENSFDDRVQQGREKGNTPLADCEEGSVETLYRLTEKEFLGGDSRVNLLPANYEGDDQLIGGARIGTTARDDESNSSETLYYINKEVLREQWQSESLKEIEVGCDLETESQGGCANGDIQSEIEGSNETMCRINIGNSTNSGSLCDSIEDDSSAEFCANEEIWCRGGLSFDSGDEEEVRSKLSRRKRLEGKKRTDLKPKDQRQGKRPPCIQGRTLATRKLMSSTKSKLK
ncbi:hypothetical protein PIB30_023170 [Stylosanthes scabra]|uniref:Uncharacterized protein n=1 Tax=Stylosanthes scabra TaxID=79078 RepID=A0ABU6T918_9FABA|nr:hypothetical protein [Stylosanthes scabra]